MLRRMEICKLVLLLVGIGLFLFIVAVYVSSDIFDAPIEKRSLTFAVFGLGVVASGILIYLLM